MANSYFFRIPLPKFCYIFLIFRLFFIVSNGTTTTAKTNCKPTDFRIQKKTSKLICLFFAIFDNLWPNVFFQCLSCHHHQCYCFVIDIPNDPKSIWKKMVVVASLLLMFFLLRMISPLSKQKEKRKITLEIVFLEWYFWSGFEKIIIFVSLSLDFDFSE